MDNVSRGREKAVKEEVVLRFTFQSRRLEVPQQPRGKQVAREKKCRMEKEEKVLREGSASTSP